jgi:hypothetical protein
VQFPVPASAITGDFYERKDLLHPGIGQTLAQAIASSEFTDLLVGWKGYIAVDLITHQHPAD